jgi:hypothetical protein
MQAKVAAVVWATIPGVVMVAASVVGGPETSGPERIV